MGAARSGDDVRRWPLRRDARSGSSAVGPVAASRRGQLKGCSVESSGRRKDSRPVALREVKRQATNLGPSVILTPDPSSFL